MSKKVSSFLLCMLIIASLITSSNITMVSAAKKATLKTKEITLVKGEKKQIDIKNKKKGAIYSFKSKNTTKVSVNSKGVVTAKEVGKAEVEVMETIKKNKNKIGTVSVTVKDNKPSTTPTATPTTAPTSTPVADTSSKTLKEYIEDTNMDVPSDFWTRKSDVNYGQVKNIEYSSTATNSKRKAKVILPDGYSTEKKYPVLYLLHGIGGDENSLYNDNVQTVIGNAIASGVAEKMIVVLPNACANETGKPPKDAAGKELFFSLEHYKAYDNFINDLKDCLMPYMSENFSVATGRENTAIAGFSMGGRVSLHIGFSMPESIRYIGGLCPAPGILEYTNYGVAEKGLFTKQSFTLPEQYMNDTLVLIAKGKTDDIVREFPLIYHNTLVANKVPHIYYETMGGINNKGNGGHGGDVYKHGLYNFLRRIFHN